MFSSDEALVRLAEANVPGLKRDIARLRKKLAAAEAERDKLAVERNSLLLAAELKEKRIKELEAQQRERNWRGFVK